MNILIAGGTGFIGSALVKALSPEGHSLTVLSRNERSANEKLGSAVHVLPWDGAFAGAWTAALNDTDAVINLAGESIGASRWTKERKKNILNSRISATRAIVDGIVKSATRPAVLINASAVGFYGNIPNGDVDESHAPGDDYLANVCKEWETEARRVESAGVRCVLLRTGIVLSQNGGALAKMLPPFKYFIGGSLGTGAQWMPWIHIADEIGVVKFALLQGGVTGAVNCTAPNPVTMKEFARSLGKAMHRPAIMPVPSIALKMMLGEMSKLVLEGQHAIPNAILKAGYQFQFPQLDVALKNVLRKR